MYFPAISEEGNTRTYVNKWRGYNHNYMTDLGEFFDMENLSSDQYPLASVRKVRTCLTKEDEKDTSPYIRGVVFNNGSVWCLIGTDLVNMSTQMTYDISDVISEETHTSEQTLLVMGALLVIYPLKVWVNLNDVTDRGKMESSYEVAEGITITYQPCSYSGSALQNLTTSDDAPSSPTHGDYWICTDPDKQGLYYYNGYLSSWEAVATSYIKIGIPGVDLTDYFEEGDAVFMNTKLPDINNGSVIQKIASGYIIVIGLMKVASDSQVTSSSWKLKLERRVPTLDHVCVHKNRMWGCHYGYDQNSHRTVNEIYASKLGDCTNWYVFQGLSTDSYSLTVGEMGQFTGCISFQGYPHFFKENVIYKIYGDYPSEYQLVENHCLGVQAGSGKSLAIVGNYLLYKAVSDVCIFDGSSPVSISKPLSRTDMFYDAVAGGCKDKYYISMQTAAGATRMFVFDTQYGIWEKESALKFIQFTKSLDGQLYAITAHNLYGLGDTNNAVYLRSEAIEEEWVEWYADTGEIGYEYADKKYVSKATVRAYVPTRSEVEVLVSYDDRPFESVGTIRAYDDVKSTSLSFSPYRCDHFKIRFTGHGDCMIYTLSLTTEYGSEE